MFVSAGLATTFFLGGFLAPQIGIGAIDAVFDFIPGFVWFFCKTFLVIFLYMWFRWTFPRVRIDQLMYLEWKMLLPANLFLKMLLPANLVLLMGTGFFLAMGWIL
jgi:NADH-quinone oxidoreductase subunit H